MKVQINPNAINPHIKAAFNNAKVMGITGEVVHVSENGSITVVFTHNSDGDKKNQIFPIEVSWVNVIA